MGAIALEAIQRKGTFLNIVRLQSTLLDRVR